MWILWDSERFFDDLLVSLGFLRILGDSSRILWDSERFLGQFVNFWGFSRIFQDCRASKRIELIPLNSFQPNDVAFKRR